MIQRVIQRSTRLRRGAALLIASLLALLLAAPVAADHLTPPTIGVTQNGAGTLVRGKDASVTISGTVTCGQNGYVSIGGSLSQPRKSGYFSTLVYCAAAEGSATWQATATASKGTFSKGAATLSVNAYADVEELSSPPCDPYTNWEWCYEGWDGFYHYATTTAKSSGPITIK